MKSWHTRGLTLAVVLAAAQLPSALAAEIAKPTVDLSIYGHVGLVVWVAKDIDPVVNYYEKLGLKGIDRTNVSERAGLIYRGKLAPTTAKSAFGHMGNVTIEWIQPVTGTNLYTEFLKRHGDGVLALGYAVNSDQELEQQVQYFQSKGVKAAQRVQWTGAKGTGHGVFLDTAAKGGGMTVLVYYDPAGLPAASGIPENDFPFTQLRHYAFVVRDLKKVEAYWQYLGFGGMELEHNVSTDRIYRGQPGKFEMDIGWWRWGSELFEWVQSTQGPNIYEEYLRKHGEGLHHIGPAHTQDLDATVQMLEAKGAPPSQTGGWDMASRGKGRFAYLDTEPYGGVTVELIWMTPTAK